MRRGFLLPTLCLMLATAAYAQHWNPVGNADARCTVADPVHARVYFGLTGGIRIYDIPGNSWTNHDDPDLGLYFLDIAWRPDDAQRLLSAQYTAYFDAYIGVSEDLGATWDLRYCASQETILDIEHDPTNLERCFAIVIGWGIVRSLDGGDSWDLIYSPQEWMYSLDIDGVGTVYAGTEIGILRSDDGGDSWSDATGDLPVVEPVGHLATDPSQPGHLYAGLGWSFVDPCSEALGLFESFDGGAHWTKILEGRIDNLDLHPEAPWILVADRCHPEEESSLLLSRDGGATWQDIRGDLPEYASVESLALSAYDDRLYISGYEGTFTMDLTPTQVENEPLARLLGSCPNPFNPKTTIRFALAEAGVVELAVYTLGGRRLATLLEAAPLPAGEHAVTWNGQDDGGRSLASGVYLCRLRTNDASRSSLKVTLLR